MIAENNTNRSVERTRKYLRRAYCVLISKAPHDRISVKDLCEESEIARATFYSHFSNMDDFREYVYGYITKKTYDQLLFFIKDGRNGISVKTKKNHLLFSQEDMELFRNIKNKEEFVFYHRIAGYSIIKLDEFIQSSLGEAVYEANKVWLGLFISGYVLSVLPELCDYDEEKNFRNMERVFTLYETFIKEKTVQKQ